MVKSPPTPHTKKSLTHSVKMQRTQKAITNTHTHTQKLTHDAMIMRCIYVWENFWVTEANTVQIALSFRRRQDSVVLVAKRHPGKALIIQDSNFDVCARLRSHVLGMVKSHCGRFPDYTMRSSSIWRLVMGFPNSPFEYYRVQHEHYHLHRSLTLKYCWNLLLLAFVFFHPLIQTQNGIGFFCWCTQHDIKCVCMRRYCVYCGGIVEGTFTEMYYICNMLGLD